MKETIRTHLEELQTSATRMLVLNSDNSMLISYFKDLLEKLKYLYRLNEMETTENWSDIQNAYNSLIKLDSELTEVDLKIKVKPATSETKTGKITIKMY